MLQSNEHLTRESRFAELTSATDTSEKINLCELVSA